MGTRSNDTILRWAPLLSDAYAEAEGKAQHLKGSVVMLAQSENNPHIEQKERVMSYQGFVLEVAERLGWSERDAEHAVATVLEVLGQRLRDVDAEAVAAQLPGELGRRLVAARYEGGFDVSEFQRRISVDDPLRASRAVCQVLAETLDEQGRAQLRMQPLSSLFSF
jgi:uncharacterized protein (DUF2267 family)